MLWVVETLHERSGKWLIYQSYKSRAVARIGAMDAADFLQTKARIVKYVRAS